MKETAGKAWAKRPLIISGPCSAETEEQVLQTAQRLAATSKVDMLRAGIWKPRTKPGMFEGIGAKGLPWLQQAKKLTGLPTTVEVATGKQTVRIKAGQKAITGTDENILQKQINTDQLYNYYRSKKFVCEDTPLWKLVEKLNEAYDVQIVFGNDSVRNQKITTIFDNEPLDKILSVIKGTFNISATKEKGQIILR